MTQQTEFADLKQEEIIELMKETIKRKGLCFVKYTCGRCRERVTCSTPNAFFTEGYIHEDCGFTSFPTEFGLSVMFGVKIEREGDDANRKRD